MSHLAAFKARFVFPVSRPPIAGGVVTVADGCVLAVGENLSASPPIDLGDVAIVPGLVNAHTHLEFSDLAVPLGARGMSLPAWIALVVAHRREQTAHNDASRQREGAIVRGLAELRQTGTSLVGEIATWPWPREPFASAPRAPQVVAFHEYIALSPERAALQLAAAEDWLTSSLLANASHALSPHAPYSVHIDLVEQLVARAKKFDVPVAMHLAESPEEMELLASGGGPFRELLQSLGAWNENAAFGRYNIRDYLQRLALVRRALVIHGNYLSDDDRAFIANHGNTMSVVYCPRTHEYFGHERYPLEALLAAGVRVALGTDSRASNPNLNLWGEMQFVAEKYPSIDPAAILAMGTQAGAAALGQESRFGEIATGRAAHLAVVPIGGGQANDPHELLFAAGAAASFPLT